MARKPSKKAASIGNGSPAGSRPSYYVGVGASAGGLEALESFFKAMPPDSGMAFIVIQHLSPDYKSLMVELLSKRTAMAVHRAEDGMTVVRDAIYLIPPKKNLTLFHGKLMLSDPDHSRGINLPIDVFLRSLADDQGDKAVAIILSGTGSDGMRGVRAVKEAGGIVMVQSQDSAKFDGMPRSAISTGLADFVLAPEQMPDQLLSFTRHPYVCRPRPAEQMEVEPDGLTRIFALLRDRVGIDFTFYKPSTVMRRIERRMTVNQIHDIADYAGFIEAHPREAVHLHRELLIGVTSFFRDREAFETLAQKYIPEMLDKAGQREIRCWVAGCSTGEEAYTLAILFMEAMERRDRMVDVKIFATDIDRDAVIHAGNGQYPESIAADLPPGLLAKYFHRHGDNFRVSRAIREMVVFAQHNLIKDPPFTSIDLLSCRNLLIYLQPVLQRKVMDLFNFSLNPGAVLLLGTSEAVGEMSDYFDLVHPKWKIYRCKGKRKPAFEPADSVVAGTAWSPPRSVYTHRRGIEDERVLERLLHGLAGDVLPLTLVVNENQELLHVIGEAGGLLRLPSGKMVNDVARMAVKELAIPLATGLQKAFKKKEEIKYTNIRLNLPEGLRTVELRLRPLPGKKGQDPLMAVFLRPADAAVPALPATEGQNYDLGKETEQRMADLEQELQFTRENLQATIEELETSNEELQATNEELLASNEELQSTNEELQSVNEELHTVNAEYQSKILELTELTNDMDNLLASTGIGTLFLDENLEIRKFTPLTAEIFRILEKDVGRPIGHLTHRLQEDDPLALIATVQQTHQPLEREVRNDTGRWFLLRVLPYAVGPRTFSGVVVTVIDIDRLKAAELALRRERDLVARIMETSPAGITLVDRNGKVSFANQRAEQVLRLQKDKITRRAYNDPDWKITGPDGGPFAEQNLPFARVMATGKPVAGVRHGIETPDGQRTLICVNAAPLTDADGTISAVVCTVDDISERQAAADRYQELFTTMASGVAVYQAVDDGADFVFADINPAVERIEAVRKEDVIGKRLVEVFPGAASFGLVDMLARVWRSGRPEDSPPAFYQDGRISGWRSNSVYRLASGQVVAVYQDVTGTMLTQAELTRRRLDVQVLMDVVPDPMVCLEPDGTIAAWNEAATRFFGHRADTLRGRRLDDIAPAPITTALMAALGAALDTARAQCVAVDGGDPPAEIHCLPSLDGQGRVAGAFVRIRMKDERRP